jgi:DNA-binding transcriptional regulator YdaS (Cro superfamily)
MEQLRTYLEGRNKGDFARSVNIVPVYLSHILSGVRTPSLALALRIARATDGAVPVESWVQTHQLSPSAASPENAGGM